MILIHSGTCFGIHFETRSTQEKPRWAQPSRAPKYQKPTCATTLEKHMSFKGFLGSRAFQEASGDPRKPPKGYLRLLWAILSHSRTILETSACKIAAASVACVGVLCNFGVYCGPEIRMLFVMFAIYWLKFGTKRKGTENYLTNRFNK